MSWSVRLGLMAGVLAVVACGDAVSGAATTTTEAGPSTTTTTIAVSTTSIRPPPVGGHLIKLDTTSLRPLPGLDPIPVGSNSWSIASEDGEWMAILEYSGDVLRGVTPLDVTEWRTGEWFEEMRHSARTLDDGVLYMYDDVDGELSSLDFRTGQHSVLGHWPAGLWMWDELHLVGDDQLVALGADVNGTAPVHFSALWLDLASGETSAIEMGPIERFTSETGVFDGTYEIPRSDIPAVVWGDDRVLVVHADGPDVTVAEFESGTVESHLIDVTTWLDRLVGYWMPAAIAKGPSLGTYSSAALSSDQRFLLISGNRYEVGEAADGGMTEETIHLGLTVVDTESWRVVDQPDLPFQYVGESGGVIFGVDTRSTSPWIDDVYTVTIDDTGIVSHADPIPVEGGNCPQVIGGAHLLCVEYTAQDQALSMVEIGSGAIVAGLSIGMEDYLHGNGVLHDWSPALDWTGN